MTHRTLLKRLTELAERNGDLDAPARLLDLLDNAATIGLADAADAYAREADRLPPERAQARLEKRRAPENRRSQGV
jgi:hypothetical protein